MRNQWGKRYEQIRTALELDQRKSTDNFKLGYTEIEKILGFPIDHSVLTFKEELSAYGFTVGKISMREQTVSFEKIRQEKLEVMEAYDEAGYYNRADGKR